MTFSQSISTCFNKYATFSGRASRSEYWWFYLFNCLVTTAAMILDMALGFDVEVVHYLTALALFCRAWRLLFAVVMTLIIADGGFSVRFITSS